MSTITTKDGAEMCYIVPIGPSAHASSELMKQATLKIYPGGSHGPADTNTDQLNADPLAFLET